MSSIYQKAQQECTRAFRQEILNKLEGLPADMPDWREALKNAIDDIVQFEEQPSVEVQPEAKREPWDFSREKSQATFVCGDGIVIRPITPEDGEFYCGIRMQYSLIHRSLYYSTEDKKKCLFLREALSPEVFYCVICDSDENQPIGYLGIKDTSADLWEIAIELDAKYTRRGLGPQSIRLYLNEIQCLTGKDEFRAKVEVDNVPSQKCFERIGAELAGLCDSVVLNTDDEKRRFEDRNLDLIDAHMIDLADHLGVESRTLLSHVLDYRLTCPL